MTLFSLLYDIHTLALIKRVAGTDNEREVTKLDLHYREGRRETITVCFICFVCLVVLVALLVPQ